MDFVKCAHCGFLCPSDASVCPICKVRVKRLDMIGDGAPGPLATIRTIARNARERMFNGRGTNQ